jgi:hypothetical protein
VRGCLLRWQGRCVDLREVLIALSARADSRDQVWRLLEQVCFGQDFVGVLVGSPQVACISFGRGLGRARPRAHDEVQRRLVQSGWIPAMQAGGWHEVGLRGLNWCIAQGAAPGSCRRLSAITIAQVTDSLPATAIGVVDQIFQVGELESFEDAGALRIVERRALRAAQGATALELDQLVNQEKTYRLLIERRARRRVASTLLQRRLVGM